MELESRTVQVEADHVPFIMNVMECMTDMRAGVVSDARLAECAEHVIDGNGTEEDMVILMTVFLFQMQATHCFVEAVQGMASGGVPHAIVMECSMMWFTEEDAFRAIVGAPALEH